MTWFKIDDGLYDHPKWMSTSLEGRALWLHCAVWCSKHLTDGAVPSEALEALGFAAKVPIDRIRPAAAELVKRGLWRKVRGGWEFHQWLELQPSREQVEKQRGRWARTKRLYRDRSLVDMIRARDGDVCRYCGRAVRWDDRRTAAGAVFDHVDPNRDDAVVNDPDNVVVSCRACNSRKNERTPEAAGMVLRPAPGPDVSRDNLGTDRRLSDPRDGTGSADGTGRDLVRVGSGLAGSGPVRAGPGLAPRGALRDLIGAGT